MGDLETGQRGQQSRRSRAPPVQKKVHARDFGLSEYWVCGSAPLCACSVVSFHEKWKSFYLPREMKESGARARRDKARAPRFMFKWHASKRCRLGAHLKRSTLGLRRAPELN
ncbi:hypothetical protein C4D60_Mb10t19250 [Musa balbisiana]|uniref:Uncharacterized protein n=1 Tax=Musa balbisiana TaxID=52838 RepID=A0A4S8IY97_MUSBA|nr:hypothetical protein C4D60_Mb10t19250 [Musa balbisiana]